MSTATARKRATTTALAPRPLAKTRPAARAGRVDIRRDELSEEVGGVGGELGLLPDPVVRQARERLHAAIDEVLELEPGEGPARRAERSRALRRAEAAERAYIDALSRAGDWATCDSGPRCDACGGNAERLPGGAIRCGLCPHEERPRCTACGADAQRVHGRICCPLCEGF